MCIINNDELININIAARVGSLNHPFHLHGYSFAVMDMGTFEKENKTLEQILQEFNLNRIHKVQSPAFVDTIAVPTQGYAILRFKADNPGKCFHICLVFNRFLHRCGGVMIRSCGILYTVNNVLQTHKAGMTLNVEHSLTPWLMEPGGSMPHSQGLSNNSYTQPNQPNSPH